MSDFIYRFYSDLKKDAKLPLTSVQYTLLYVLLSEGFGWESREQFYELCQTLWLMDPKKEKIFKDTFDNIWSKCTSMELKPTDSSKKGLEKFSTKDEFYLQDIKNDFLEKKPKKIEEPKNQRSLFPENELMDTVFLEIADQIESGSPVESEEMNAGFSNTFIFSDWYFPLRVRKLQSIWKYLNHNQKKRLHGKIDIDSTIDEIARKGFFSEFIAEKGISDEIKVEFLIDHGGSMVGFQMMVEQIIESCRLERPEAYSDCWYFYNYIDEWVYSNKSFITHSSFDKWLQKLTKKTLIIILSDAGAARMNYNEERIESSRTMIEHIQKQQSQLVWLNPISKAKWKDSSAEEIARFVKMISIPEEMATILPDLLKKV